MRRNKSFFYEPIACFEHWTEIKKDCFLCRTRFAKNNQNTRIIRTRIARACVFGREINLSNLKGPKMLVVVARAFTSHRFFPPKDTWWNWCVCKCMGGKAEKTCTQYNQGRQKQNQMKLICFLFPLLAQFGFKWIRKAEKEKHPSHLHTHTLALTLLSQVRIFRPLFSLAHFLGFSDSLAFFAHLNCWQKDFHSAFLPLSISPCHSTFVSFVSGISALSLAKA